jgi:dTDP-4-dehydrorhamnose reductase
MRVLIIGATGLLGSDLVEEWKGDDVTPASSKDADIRDIAQVRGLVSRSRPDWIVLAAAYTDVDASERNPALAFAINRDGTKNVAVASREFGAKLCYLSTDYLYDGRSNRPYQTTDPLHPLNAYGESKAAGESAVADTDHWLIVRTSWLFGAARPSFPEAILRAADTQPEVRVVSDQVGSPTYAGDLAKTIRRLVQMDARGILNATNAGSCSRFEFAKEILERAGRETRLKPIESADAGRLARRPVYSVLSPDALRAQGITMRPWQETVVPYLVDLRRRGKLR